MKGEDRQLWNGWIINSRTVKDIPAIHFFIDRMVFFRTPIHRDRRNVGKENSDNDQCTNDPQKRSPLFIKIVQSINLKQFEKKIGSQPNC